MISDVETRLIGESTGLSSSAEPSAGVRFERMIVRTIDHMKEIAADPKNAGRTFRVTKEVCEYFISQLVILPRKDGEMERINGLLGTSFDESYPGGLTRVCTCKHCGHEFSYADHVEAAVNMGVHGPEELKKFFTGEEYFLTVDTDKPRSVVCVSCNKPSLVAHCCYGTCSYGYA